jgi:hypothetical protein
MYVAAKLESLIYTFLFYCFVKSNSLLKVYSGKVYIFPAFLTPRYRTRKQFVSHVSCVYETSIVLLYLYLFFFTFFYYVRMMYARKGCPRSYTHNYREHTRRAVPGCTAYKNRHAVLHDS